MCVGRPVERGGQARAAVELAGSRPPASHSRAARQLAVQPASLGVLLEPAAQPRPLAQQRLVRDLDLALADRDQALVGEHGEHDLGDALVVAVELGQRHAPAHDRVALALAGQAQQDPARELAAAGRAARRRLGQPRHRAAHAAGCS